MRFQLQFSLEKNELPLNYRKMFMSFIKSSLQSCNNGEYFERYYKDTIQKDFTYAIILPGPRFSKDKISLDNNSFKVIFSADDSQKSGFILFQSFLKNKYRKISIANNNTFQLQNISLQKQKVITKDKVYMRTTTGAPLCLREHRKEDNTDKYISIADENFTEKLHFALSRQLVEHGFLEEQVQDMKIKVLDGKKVVIKHYGYIDCTACVLEIAADPFVLQYIYDNGILSRRAEGFGMLELIE